MTRAWRLLVVLLLVLGAAACASVSAKPAAVRPALDAPEPPPRTVVPPADDAAEAGPTPVIVQPTPPPPARNPRAAAPKPATEKEAPPPPAALAAPPEATRSTTDTAVLQTTARVDEAERHVRELLTNAARDLGLVDIRGLSAGAKAQYDSARRFIAQAEDALKAKNVVFAEQLATKAAALAEGLRGR